MAADDKDMNRDPITDEMLAARVADVVKVIVDGLD